MTTTSPTANNADDYEPDEYAVREELNLRTIFYSERGSTKNSHPDQRPCPSWCWVGKHEEFDHAVEVTNPMRAHHDLDVRPAVALSMYQGYRSGDMIHTATLEASLSQRGQARPTISVGKRIRDYANGAQSQKFVELVDLDVEDAREFARVLDWLVGLHDADRALNGSEHRERNAFEVGRDYERVLQEQPSGTM